MRDFKKLIIWEEGHQIAVETAAFPKQERYGLLSQMRRCAVSIPNNIAEGSGRSSEKELRRFCDIAMGATSELEYLFLLTKDLGLVNNEAYTKSNEYLIVLKKRLNAFIQKLKS